MCHSHRLLTDKFVLTWQIWPPGSLEEQVQNLVKTWEMEIFHKTNPKDYKTLDPDDYTFSLNGNTTQLNDKFHFLYRLFITHLKDVKNMCCSNIWCAQFKCIIYRKKTYKFCATPSTWRWIQSITADLLAGEAPGV